MPYPTVRSGNLRVNRRRVLEQTEASLQDYGVELLDLLPVRIWLQSNFLLYMSHLSIRHKIPPDKPRAAVFDHHCHGSLIQSHCDSGVPVLLLIERVAKTINIPELRAEIAIEMPQGQQALLWRV